MKQMIKKYKIHAILLLVIFFLIIFNRNLIREKRIYQQNVKALTDQVRLVKTKNGEKEFIIKSLVVKNKKDLKKINNALYKELKKEKGKTLTITKFNTIIKYDTIKLNNNFISYGDYNEINWSYDTIYSDGNFKIIKGVSRFKIDSLRNLNDLSTILTENVEGIEIILGYKDNGDGIEFYARSKHPYFQVNSIESVVLSSNSDIFNKYKKGKRFFLGPYVGIGIDNNLHLVPNIGIGFGYNLNR